MTTLSKIFFQSIGLAGILLLAGCSIQTNSVQNSAVPIERINSRSVTITHAQLQVEDNKLILRGEISNRFPTHAPMPGHLQIELISRNGNIFKQATIAYRRPNIKANTARFQLDIPFALSNFERIRVIHHDPGAHLTAATSSPWRDKGNNK
jgi:hypothetical protein